MKQFLKIQSKGEIEIEAFTLIGASSKRNDETKIGYFGSGLKYSISSLMRSGIQFKIFSGVEEISFGKNEKIFRGEVYEAITVNGLETSQTVTMGGSDWDSIFAPIREIYSNALDEDDESLITEANDCVGKSGMTTFYIEMTDDVRHFYKNSHLYFCNTNPNVIYSDNNGSIFSNTDGKIRIFRKGILAHFDNDKKAVFHYNLFNAEINESRVLKNFSQATCYGAQLLKGCTNRDVIETLLLTLSGGNKGYLEHELYWQWHSDFSIAWKLACEGKTLVPIEYLDMFEEEDLRSAYKLPVSLLKPLKAQFPELNILGLSSKSEEKVYAPSKASQILIDKVIDAIAILKTTRYNHRMENIDIDYVKFSDETVLGLAENGKIYLSTKLDSEDVAFIAKVIIEENEHNRSGLGDKTRNFQNHLFSLYYDELTSKK